MNVIDFDEGKKNKKETNEPTNEFDMPLYTIGQFCKTYQMSPIAFELMVEDDEAPPMFEFMGCWYITFDDANEWARTLPMYVAGWLKANWIECNDEEARKKIAQNWVAPTPRYAEDLQTYLRQQPETEDA